VAGDFGSGLVQDSGNQGAVGGKESVAEPEAKEPDRILGILGNRGTEA